MNRISISVVMALFLLMASGIASAHHASGGAGLGQAGPIRTQPATVLPKGVFSFAIQTEFIDLESFSDSELLGFSSRGKDVHTADSIFHSILSVGYGITDNLDVSIKVPYEQVNNIREAHSDEPDEIHLHGDSRGFGDMTVLAQYRFLKTADRLEAAVFGGLKMPTGRTNVRDIHGETFEAEFLPGTGSWSPIAGLAVTKRFGRFSLDANVQYTVANGGTQSTNLGDLFNYNAAVSYRAVSGTIDLDLVLEANGEWKEKQKIHGRWDGNSGGHALFISPGMRMVFARRVAATLSLALPLMEDLSGIQDDTRYKALFGLSFSLQ